jgi:hypothetical protein
LNDEAAAQTLARLLREDGTASHAGAEEDPELSRLLGTIAVLREQPRRRSHRWLWGAAAALVGLVAAWTIFARSLRRNLTYEVHGVARIEDRRVSAESSEPAEIRFSDGSTFELLPGARLSVDGSTPDGSSLSLLDGQARASVVHRSRTHWSLLAGPFEIVVVGTRFHTLWDAAHQRLRVDMEEGAVEVRGASLGEPVAVRAGQRLEAGTTRSDWRITPLPTDAADRAGATSAEPPATPSWSAPERPAPTHSTERTSTAPPAASVSWAELMTRSEFETIVTQADALGLESCFATCSPANLRVLADAARYTGRFELAERSLLALRKRSPAHAAPAAFFLARLYEARGRHQDALRMYKQNLTESPHGDYAEEAMASRMALLVRVGEPAAARVAADAYLLEFPRGTHVPIARRIIADAPAP